MGWRRLALLLLVLSCNKLREVPGVLPRSTFRAQPPRLASGPWLLDPAPAQMTIAWLSAQPEVGRVHYGAGSLDQVAVEPGTSSLEHRITLRGLLPSTRYEYRVEGAGETDSFTSAPPEGAPGPFEVLIYGDNRSNGGDHALVARAAASEHAPLSLHTGDMVVNAHDEAAWRVWFDEEHELLAHAPLVPTVGNHEITDAGAAYSRYFQHPAQPPYWSVEYGPLHIVVLDSFETTAGATPHASGMSDAQKEWMLADLKVVPKERQVWILVHQGPFSQPEKVRPAHGPSEPVLAAIRAAQAIHPLTVVFAGHEHFYERGENEGIHWFVLGGGGAPLEQPAAPGEGQGVQFSRKALSYALVQVCGCHARGVAKDIGGAVLDSFTLADCATPCGPFAAEEKAPLPAAAPAEKTSAAPAEKTSAAPAEKSSEKFPAKSPAQSPAQSPAPEEKSSETSAKTSAEKSSETSAETSAEKASETLPLPAGKTSETSAGKASEKLPAVDGGAP